MSKHRTGRRLPIALALSTAALIAPSGAGAATSTTTSTNWAGYAATGKTFKRVSGTWVQPAVDCSSGESTSYSATWVGLGGYSSDSNALEQIGTEADCSNGKASYSTWYELVPEAAKNLTLKVRAGDKVAASVTVTGKTVRMRLTNLTTGKSVVKTRTTSNLDLTSAEWIQETPSACDASGSSCQVLPLANFGAVTFNNASATSKTGHKGTITDSAWNATAIDLVETSTGGRGGFPGGPRASTVSTGTGATTGDVSTDGTSFAVNYGTTTATQAARLRRAAALGGNTVAGARRWGAEQGA